MFDFLPDLGLGIAALLAAIALVLCFAAVLHWGHDREQGLVPFIFYPAILVVSLGVLFSGRNLDAPGDIVWVTMPKHPLLVWTGRIASVFISFAAAERILKRWMQFRTSPGAPHWLIGALFFYFLTNIATSAVLSSHPSLSHEYLYTALAAYAALLVTRQEGDAAVRAARNAILVFLVMSAACLAWRPELELIRDYKGLIPWLDVRYTGLAIHPNGLAPIVVVFLLCLWAEPYRARWLNAAGWTFGGASLLLAQSKTNWIAFLACACCMAYFRHRQTLSRRFFDAARPEMPAGVVILAMMAVSALGMALMFGGVGEKVAAFFGSQTGAELLTFMGRKQIWAAAVDAWANNPVFGYGLTIWDDDHRARIGIPEAFQAHSQFFQSLSSAGTVGVLGLAVYAATLLAYAIKTVNATRGLSLALFLLIVIGSVSEVPLSMTGLGMEQLLHLLTLMVIASRCAPAGQAPMLTARRGLVSS
ncbi:MAG TPA: O-antigen ligase family protein [Noviherbaspirillum sp.]|nr:O-antigen ligase family protein [Noviherbaspirillum sp.]